MIRYVVFFALAVSAAACGGSPTDPSQVSNVAYSQADLTVGTGRVAANGNVVFVTYTGWLYDASAPDNKGKQFDTSIGRPQNAFSFRLGLGQVITGWDRGVLGMAVGGKRRLVIPPSLAYGSAGSPPVIPSNATLVFDIEVLDVTN